MQFVALWPFNSKEMSVKIKMFGKAATGLVLCCQVNMQMVNVLMAVYESC